MFGPAGMPADLVEKINRDVQAAAQSPEVKEKLTNLGAEPMPMTPSQFKAFVKRELDDSQKVVQAAGIKAQ